LSSSEKKIRGGEGIAELLSLEELRERKRGME
jgi:hypothetical protein